MSEENVLKEYAFIYAMRTGCRFFGPLAQSSFICDDHIG